MPDFLKQSCLTYSLDADDYYFYATVFSLIWLCISSLGVYIYHDNKKKMAWFISLCNSFVMVVAGSFYLITIIETQPGFFTLTKPTQALFDRRDNFSVIMSIWFAIANFCDMLFGSIFYPEQLQFLTTWIHHPMFIWVCISSTTGNALLYNCKYFSSALLLCFIEEVPTFLLAMGSVFPEMRTDYGFGLTFFLLRILYHIYIGVYHFLNTDVNTPKCLYLITTLLHILWFKSWISSMLRRGKKDKSS